MEYPGGPYEISDLQAIDKFIEQTSITYPLMEIGCWEGRSTSVLARHAKKNRQVAYCIDPFFQNMNIPEFDYNMVFAFIKNMFRLALFDNIRLLPITSKAASELQIDKISILHIDGSHNFEDVKFDIEIYAPRVEQLLICHDIDFPEVKEALQFIPKNFKIVYKSIKMGIWKI